MKPRNSAIPAGDRLFRQYFNHCLAPDLDTLFGFLEAAHSFNDRLKVDAGVTLLQIPEFVALKALRNLFHHHQELRHVVRLVPKTGCPVVTELPFLCLVPRSTVELAVEEIDKRYRQQGREACEAVFQWYGRVLNINPAIYNLMVAVYEIIEEIELGLTDEAFLAMQESYLVEEQHGLSHRVDGRLYTLAGNIDQLLEAIMNTEGLEAG